MILEVKTKVRGLVNGAIGEIVDVTFDKRGNRYAVIEWKNVAKYQFKKTEELMSHLDWLIRKGGLEVVQ